MLYLTSGYLLNEYQLDLKTNKCVEKQIKSRSRKCYVIMCGSMDLTQETLIERQLPGLRHLTLLDHPSKGESSEVRDMAAV